MKKTNQKKTVEADIESQREKKRKQRKIVTTSIVLLFCILPLVLTAVLPFML